MHTQTLQRLREEVEAASTLHLALGRIAVKANPAAPTAWTGPLLEELEDLTDDDGGFSHAGIAEIRRRSGAAIIAQYHAVKAAVDGASPRERADLQRLLEATLVTGTGNATLSTSNGATGVLSNLVKSGELRLDFAMRAAMLARDGLPPPAVTAPQRPSARQPAKTEPARPATKKAPARKPAAKTSKAAVKKKPAAKAPKAAPKKKAAAKAPRPKKTSKKPKARSAKK